MRWVHEPVRIARRNADTSTFRPVSGLASGNLHFLVRRLPVHDLYSGFVTDRTRLPLRGQRRNCS